MNNISERTPNLNIFIRLILLLAFLFGFVLASAFSATTGALAEHPPLPAEKPILPSLQYPPACQQGKTPIYMLPVYQRDPILGAAQGAIVTIVEFMDFQCPFCHKASATIRRLMESYPGKIRLVFKHYPLAFHNNAFGAAKAAVAAQRQGKFWEMAAVLFENRRTLDEDHLFQFASDVGLDTKRFAQDYKDPGIEKAIKDDMRLARSFGIRGTPVFFINGLKISGAQPLENFKSTVDELLPHAQSSARSLNLFGDALYKRLVSCGLTKQKPMPPRSRRLSEKKQTDKVYNIPAGDSYWIGGRNAKVQLIVFSDFQCPYCARHSKTIKKILDRYGNDVRIVFKNLPLSFHKNAMIAAQAAMAAGAQGRFWQMHDVLFENNKELSRQGLESYADELGLDMRRFNADIDNHTYSHLIKNDLETANEFGIHGTPTTIINGKKLAGARPFEDYVKIIDKALGR